MSTDPDSKLVARLQGCSEREREVPFRELYDRYKDRVYTTCYRITGNAADALDAAQAAFVTMHSRITSFRGEARLSSWIHRIATNASLDVHRRRRKLPEVSLDELPLHVAENAAESARSEGVDSEPEHALLREEVEHFVQRALDRLSTKLRTVAVLRYVSELSYEEIGDTLGISRGTVKSRLYRAHTALTRELDPFYRSRTKSA